MPVCRSSTPGSCRACGREIEAGAWHHGHGRLYPERAAEVWHLGCPGPPVQRTVARPEEDRGPADGLTGHQERLLAAAARGDQRQVEKARRASAAVEEARRRGGRELDPGGQGRLW